jgi:hypothetical protein
VHAIDAEVEIDPRSRQFRALHGSCEPSPRAPGSYHVQVAALDYLICTSGPAP